MVWEFLEQEKKNYLDIREYLFPVRVRIQLFPNFFFGEGGKGGGRVWDPTKSTVCTQNKI